jgi:hypothetical protein
MNRLITAGLAALLLFELAPVVATVTDPRVHAFRLAWAIARLVPLLGAIASIATGRRGGEALLFGAAGAHVTLCPSGPAFALLGMAAATTRRGGMAWPVVLAGAAATLGAAVLAEDALTLRHVLQRYEDHPTDPLVLAARMAASVFVLRRLERALRHRAG